MKKTVGIVLSIFLVLMLVCAGCSTTSDTTESASAETETTQSEAAETAAEVAEESSGEVMPADLPVSDLARVDIVNQLPDRELKIAFMTLQTNAFFDLVKAGAEEGIDYLAQLGVEVDYIDMGSTMDADTVNTALDAAIVQGYDGIVVTPFSVGTEVYIDKAVDAGIPVISLYGHSTVESEEMLFIGQDAYTAGKIVGEYVSEQYPEGGKYGIETGVFGVQVFEDRNAGFIDGLTESGADWEQVGIYETYDSADTIYTQVKDMITANPDLKCVYVSSGGNYGASVAIEELGLSDQVISAGHDEVPENLAYVADGEMVVISQDTKGVAFSALIYMYNYLVAGELPDDTFIPSDSIMIDETNVDEWL